MKLTLGTGMKEICDIGLVKSFLFSLSIWFRSGYIDLFCFGLLHWSTSLFCVFCCLLFRCVEEVVFSDCVGLGEFPVGWTLNNIQEYAYVSTRATILIWLSTSILRSFLCLWNVGESRSQSTRNRCGWGERDFDKGPKRGFAREGVCVHRGFVQWCNTKWHIDFVSSLAYFSMSYRAHLKTVESVLVVRRRMNSHGSEYPPHMCLSYTQRPWILFRHNFNHLQRFGWRIHLLYTVRPQFF